MGLITAEDFGEAVGEDNDAPEGIYSNKRLISPEDWSKIQDYYLSNAPDKLPAQKHPKMISEDFTAFQAVFPKLNKKRPNLTTLTRWNKEEGKLYLGDRLQQLFQIEGKTLAIVDSISITSPVSAIRFFPEKQFDLLTMGVMGPSNFAVGRLSKFRDFQSSASDSFLDSLRRPVHFSPADLNQNGREDLIVCNFGHHIGNLSWYENTDDGFVPHLLNAHPGAIKTVIADVNADGLPDIVVLMTQAREGVYAYINEGGGKFTEQRWLQFHPVFGGSDFDLLDMNGDGHLDLVLVNGNNADNSPILKPYHGIRIFLNDGTK